MTTTLYTSDHEWLAIDGDVATVGITDYAQSQLGDVVFVELPKVGRTLKKTEAAAVGGEPALVNSDAQGKAWFFKIKIADKSELGGLMDEAAYKAHTA